jgi:uncharacterized membrane protein
MDSVGAPELIVIFLILLEFVLPVVLIVLGIRWLLARSANGRLLGPRDGDAVEVLRQRYARGEIDATEFEERKRVLGG